MGEGQGPVNVGQQGLFAGSDTNSGSGVWGGLPRRLWGPHLCNGSAVRAAGSPRQVRGQKVWAENRTGRRGHQEGGGRP